MKLDAPELRLTTARLLLRPFEPRDAPRVRLLAGVREVAATTLRIPHPYPASAAAEFIGVVRQGIRRGDEFGFAVTLRPARGRAGASGELIGAVGLHGNAEHDRAELGYWIGTDYWGRGYCTEAAAAVVRFGFEVLALHRIHAHCFAPNRSSGRVLQKLGMVYEGTLRQHVRKWGEHVDLHCYAILRSNWERRAADATRP
jgi:RimJ/RimL family protein N-acetyltransferase